MASIFEGDCTSGALCWTLERADGAGLALTSFDKPLLLGSIVNDPEPGMLPAAIIRRLGLEPHSSEVGGALTSDAITEADLTLGRWDGARVRLTAVDWQDADAASAELFAGELANIDSRDQEFSAELQGAAIKLNQPVCPATSRLCRAELGDKSCRVDLAGRSIAAKVVSVSGTSVTLDQTVDDRFVLGRLRFLGGTCCALATVILAVDGPTVSIRDLPRAPVEAGCEVELREGCDKSLATCSTRFANAANFRGEPHLPGNDVLTRYPGV